MKLISHSTDIRKNKCKTSMVVYPKPQDNYFDSSIHKLAINPHLDKDPNKIISRSLVGSPKESLLGQKFKEDRRKLELERIAEIQRTKTQLLNKQ